MLETKITKELKKRKNLLAFSAGGDSTALFFLLIHRQIDFDIAIVDYNIREQSKEEVAYAKELAKKYHLKCHTLKADTIHQNFESNAREIRYNFFEKLISEYQYDNLLTAHHLGDRFEWMLMQFCKGAGCVELIGMQSIEKRDGFKIIRPLLHLDKSELLNFLHLHSIKYFEDESNNDEKYKRNSFRHNHTKPLLDKYLQGIKKSFSYMDEDRANLIQEIDIKKVEDFAYFKSSNNKRADIFAIDRYLKTGLYMPTAHEREMLKSEKTVVLGRKIIVNQEHGFVFIAPFESKTLTMPKEFKEEMRRLKIEPKLRAFFYTNPQAFQKIKELIL